VLSFELKAASRADEFARKVRIPIVCAEPPGGVRPADAGRRLPSHAGLSARISPAVSASVTPLLHCIRNRGGPEDQWRILSRHCVNAARGTARIAVAGEPAALSG